MATTAQQVADLARERLEDTSGTTYTDAQALAWINQGQRAICHLRPDAKTAVKNLTLVQGAKQTLDAGDRRLMFVTMNMGAGGATRGAVIDGPVDFNRIGRFDRTWAASANESTTVLEYAYDPSVPDTFWVNPPQTSSPEQIEVGVAQDPTDVALIGSNIDLGDIYVPMLVEWLLFCFFGRADERSPTYQRSRDALETFYQLLGVKTQGDTAITPERIERGG